MLTKGKSQHRIPMREMAQSRETAMMNSCAAFDAFDRSEALPATLQCPAPLIHPRKTINPTFNNYSILYEIP
jgi:hypothetical protein